MVSESRQRKLGVVIGYVSVAIRNIAALMLIPFIISQVGVNNYGLYSLVTAITGYLIIIELGLANTTIRFLSRYRGQQDTTNEHDFFGYIQSLYYLITFIAVIAGLLMWQQLPYWFVNSLTANEISSLQSLFLVALVNIAITLLSNCFTGAISASERFVYLKTLEIAVFIVRCLLVIIFLNKGFGILAIVAIDTAANGISYLGKVLYVRRVLRYSFRLRIPPLAVMKEISLYTFFIALNVIINQVNWRADSIILGAMTDTASVGIFNIGSQLILAFIAFASTMTTIFMPKLMKMVAKGATPKQLTDEMINVGRYQVLILGFVLTCFIGLGRMFIELFVGTAFSEAFWVALIPMIPFIFVLAQSSSNAILQSMNKHKVRSLLLLLTAILNILLSIYLVDFYGLVGAAIGTAITLVVGELILVNIYLVRVIKLEMFRFYGALLKTALPAILLTSLLLIFTAPMLSNSWLNLIMGCLVSFIAYSCLVITLALSQAERSTLIAWLGARFKRAE